MRNAPVAILVALAMVVELVVVVGPQRFGPEAMAGPGGQSG